MGNVSGREDDSVDSGGGDDDPSMRSNGYDSARDNHAPSSRVGSSSDLMANSPPDSPQRSRSPLLFAPQVPAVPLQGDCPPFSNQMLQDEPEDVDYPTVPGIPTLITWSYGGNNVFVEGSWDNWVSRKSLHRAGKDHSLFLVLPSGIYQYKFIVDGEVRYCPELPHEADEMGHVLNLLDVNDYVAENRGSVAEFQAPPSPDSSYSQAFPGDEDFAKEPVIVPPQLHLTVLGTENAEEASPSSASKPQHVVLDHLFIEKGWASTSMVTLGLTHRFESKYVTVVLYKPLKR